MTIIINSQKEIHEFYSEHPCIIPDKLLWTLLSYDNAIQSIRICFYIAEYECIATFPWKIMRWFFMLTPQPPKNEKTMKKSTQHQWRKDITLVSTLHASMLHTLAKIYTHKLHYTELQLTMYTCEETVYFFVTLTTK
jgi:hypothetical protein